MKKNILLIGAILLPACIALTNLYLNNLNFWYDPARDLLAAWNNLSKPTLIGPISGIPGIHYGPYWIWLLSFGLLFSKNPLIVTFITATIPYFVLFPLVWFRLSKIFDKTTLILCWLLFIFGSGMTYATSLWNPYPAPLLTVAAIVFLMTTDLTKIKRTPILLSLLSGFLIGLVVNFHLSFGITLLLGIALFLIIDTVLHYYLANKKQRKSTIKNQIVHILTIGVGMGIAYLPTLAFEVRHGFLQTKALLHAFTHYGNVVTVKGLSKVLIFDQFLKTFGAILHVSKLVAGILFLLICGILLYFIIRKRITYRTPDTRFLLLSITLLASTAFIYFTAKNPIWSYHFIGVDIIFLFFLTYAVTKIPLLQKILAVWVIFVTVFTLSQFIHTLNGQESSFDQEIGLVKSIAQNANNTHYSVYDYSPSIYTYDYSYLFRWIVNKDIPYDPGRIKPASVNYLIVPLQKNSKVTDFIHYRAPQRKYRVVKTWHTASGIEVIKTIERSQSVASN